MFFFCFGWGVCVSERERERERTLWLDWCLEREEERDGRRGILVGGRGGGLE